MRLERRDVAAQRNGVVRIKKDGKRIGTVEKVQVYGVSGDGWTNRPCGAIQWWSTREAAVSELIRLHNEREQEGT